MRQSVNFYTKNCERFIEDMGHSLGDDAINDYLEDYLNELKAEFEENHKPIPEQWVSKLNEKANIFNKDRLVKRNAELHNDMQNIEARLFYVHTNIFKNTISQKS